MEDRHTLEVNMAGPRAFPEPEIFSNGVEYGRKEEERDKIDLDTILVEEIGQFGKYQARNVALCVAYVIFVAWAASEYVFTTARISTRCLIPECESENTEYTPSWVLNAIPGTSQTSFENCERYTNVSSGYNETCPVVFFDQSATQACDQYVYENTDTVVYDYDLGCDDWRRSLIGSVRTFGTLCALPITGYVSDHWGRKIALSVNALNTAWIGIIRYWANTYWGFMISEFIEAVVGSGGFSCAYILVMELVGPKYRVAGGAAMNTVFAVGQIAMGLIAWSVPNWRNLTLTLYIPQLLTIAFFWIMSESVRWLLSKGRYEEAEEILQKVARVNGKQLSPKSLEKLRLTCEEEKRINLLKAQNPIPEPWLPVLVFRNKPILIRCLVSPFWWVTTMFVYYGLSINSVNMSGNKYVNYVAVSAMEIPGYWTAVFLLGRIGRKPVLIGAFWACAACMIAYIFVPAEQYGLSLAMYLIGKYCIAMVMTSIYVYTNELYPTKYRHSLFGYSSMIGRIGSILAPLTPALSATLWDNFPITLFAAFCLVSGCLVFITPETLGTNLPDTLEEAAELGNRPAKR